MITNITFIEIFSILAQNTHENKADLYYFNPRHKRNYLKLKLNNNNQ